MLRKESEYLIKYTNRKIYKILRFKYNAELQDLGFDVLVNAKNKKRKRKKEIQKIITLNHVFAF